MLCFDREGCLEGDLSVRRLFVLPPEIPSDDRQNHLYYFEAELSAHPAAHSLQPLKAQCVQALGQDAGLQHALGSRARKAPLGILTVRFEMPFPIWCTTCKPNPMIIGQGVRFNAEKKKVGNYYSTPVYSFRMKHTACGGWIEIRTDPKNTAYVVVEGARKRDTGDDVAREGDLVIESAEEKEKRQSNAFAVLEGKVEEKRQVFSDKTRIEELWVDKEKAWDDPYERSRKLRKVFRDEKKIREKDEEKTEALRDRMSLGMELLAESEEDRRRAGFVDFGVGDGEMAVVKAKSKPLFAAAGQKRQEGLQLELENNTRAAVDPFLDSGKPVIPAAPLIKRKKATALTSNLAIMASKPSCKDYGIPASLAVPPGVLMSGWSDNDVHYTSRIILYNLHVIYDMQREIIRRLDRQSTPVASDTDILERPNGGDQVRPDTLPTVPIQQYLDAAAAAAAAAVPQHVTATMAPSDSVTSDLAGLLIDCSPSNTGTLPPSPPAAEDDDTEQLVSLPKPDDRLWARLHELAGNDDDASVSSAHTAKQDHLDLTYGAADADGSTLDRFTCDLPASQSPVRSPSSAALGGDNNDHSTSTHASSATKSPHEIPPVHEHPSLATASSQRSNPQIQFGTTDWEIATPSQVIPPAQQEPLVHVDNPAVTQPTAKRTITTTTTTTNTTPNYTFEQWRSQAERQSIKLSNKEKQKADEFSFW
ncbi:MAG: hypothetical protein Q9173_004592 [Seirophora scorigena]